MHPSEIRTTHGADMELPEEFSGLRALAYNLWWSWTPSADRLFQRLDPDHWLLYRNPIELLINVTPRRWESVRNSESFREAYVAVMTEFYRYLGEEGDPPFVQSRPEHRDDVIAYFSTEFGWHECLQIYSGGLGILSGDHSKAASDLGLPFIGIGLAYHRGYFRQTVDYEGNQQHFYPQIDLSRQPLRTVVDEHNAEIRVAVELPGREVRLRLWKADIGRVPVLLLDSDVEENDPADRKITSILYVQGREMRLCQEILLGIGGVRALRALGVEPAVWHINEGHSALLSLERMRERIEGHGEDLDRARAMVAADAVFTTHTPVPAGNESFDEPLIRKYLDSWCERCGVPFERLMALGRAYPDQPDQFNLTALGLRTCSRTTGVSELHGNVANGMWRHLWEREGDDSSGTPWIRPPAPRDDRFVEHVTNGVHVNTWLGGQLREVLARHLGRDFMLGMQDAGFPDAVRAIPDEEVWAAHREQKERLIDLARERVVDQLARYGRAPDELREADTLLDSEALTIGFARRFATYKRATLVLSQSERLQAILGDGERPVQLVFAGKAHPADRPGQELIRHISQLSHSEGFRGRIVFLENYNMRVGRCLVQGVDLWLNNPRRPLEASGTSGMKVALNGGLNLSVLDGWWCEGYDAAHGWAIGDADPEADHEQQDRADAEALYGALAEQVVPAYYDRDESGLPRGWIARMKEAIATLLPRFSAARMVHDYTEGYYLPAMERGDDGAQ
jgi:starch phosphorylase